MEKVFELVYNSLPNSLWVQEGDRINPYIFSLTKEGLISNELFDEEMGADDYELCFRVNQVHIVIMYASKTDYAVVEFLVLSKNKGSYMINYDFRDEQTELTEENLQLAFETEFEIKLN